MVAHGYQAVIHAQSPWSALQVCAATNVAAALPAGWTAVTQDATDCAVIAPSGSCTLSFASTAPYVAQGNIPITGDNIASPPVVALAFTLEGYLVFSVDSPGSASVIDTADLGATPWGDIDVVTGAQSLSDGSSNTTTISSTAGIGQSAAVDCNQSTDGGATAGTWYLPAICQMGAAGQGAGCAAGGANVDTNLTQLGFGGLSGYYWSSTEYSAFPTNAAWLQSFQSGGGSLQLIAAKADVFGVRCVRSLSY
jgi:hypothetical protein